MSDNPVVDGDIVTFLPPFIQRTVMVAGVVKFSGTSHVTCNGKAMCTLGDETRVSASADYLIPAYSPGKGIVKIQTMAPNQIAPTVLIASKPVLLRGTMFIAQFTPMTPAINTSSGVPDPNVPGTGQGMVVTTTVTVLIG